MGEKYKHRKWYVYLGGSPFNTDNYQLTSSTPTCSNGKNLCAIYAKGYAEQPEEFSQAMRIAIANAFATCQRQLTESGIPIVLMK